MYCDAAQLFAHDLTFAGMDASTHLHVETLDSTDDSSTTTHGPCGTVKGSKKTVTGRVDLSAPVALELLAYKEMVMPDKLSPRPIADLGCSLSRVDDVREENCGKDSVRLSLAPGSRQERLDLAAQSIGVARPRIMISLGLLYVLGARDMLRKVSTLLNPDRQITRPMQDKRRDRDCGKNVPHVDLVVHPGKRQRRSWAGCGPLQLFFVVAQARRETFNGSTLPPIFFEGY
jgi:hypothetical protein